MLRIKDLTENSNVHFGVVRYRFGNWSNALLAAGLEPMTNAEKSIAIKERQTISDNDLLIALLKLYYKYGKITHDLINSENEYSVRPYISR
jgi:hypothetical protein